MRDASCFVRVLLYCPTRIHKFVFQESAILSINPREGDDVKNKKKKPPGREAHMFMTRAIRSS